MAKTKIRIIQFYTIQERNLKTGDISPAHIIRDTIKYIKGLPRVKRSFDINSDKFCLLESISEEKDDVQTLIFKSAKADYRPNLIKRGSLAERKNPKEDGEGENEKTHVVLKYTNDDIFLVLEKNGLGLRINPIIRYLKKFTRQYLRSKNEKMPFTFDCPAMAKNNFLSEINKLKRIIIGKVYVEKAILGSDELDFSDRIQPIQHDIIINISAKRRDNIIGPIKDIYNKLTAPKSKISKIRVFGKNNAGGEVMVDTSFINKVEHVEADINALTGEINTSSLLSQLKEIATAL